ncbi:MAG: hypothetical protein HQL37_06780 [Alphaproteobacteria bacterium]|nr:hypothetical protein [Alphaproteobacteria bacterium]
MSLIPPLPQKFITALRPYWRRRWTMIICAWCVCVLGWLGIATIPDRYEAMTRIYVETENLLTPLLRNITVTNDIQKQIEVLQRTLLNHANMAQVAHATDMDLELNTDYEKERLYESLSNRVTIKAEGQNLFSVSYRDSNPQLAKKVVETMLTLFVETNLGQNRKSMENARAFLENQIQEYEQKLKNSDQLLARYKSQHLDMLAATGSNFTARMEAMRQEQVAARSKYENAVASRDLQRISLTSTPQFLEITSSPQVVINNAGTSGGGSSTAGMSARNRVRQLRQELEELRNHYTDHHPDVLAAQRALKTAENELEIETRNKKNDIAQNTGGNSVSNPVYEQLKLRVIQAESDVAQAQIQLNNVNIEMNHLQSLAATAPQVEADLAGLNREYSVIKAKYEELLSRRESARISEAVENSGDKIQFRVIEAPQVPTRPTFPNRPVLATLVLFLGLGAGGGIIFLLHKIDDTVGSTSVLANEFNVRVLGSIPRVESMVVLQDRRRKARNFTGVTVSLLGAYVAVMMASMFWQLSELLSHIKIPFFLLRILRYVG